jgi:hypothetical protein
MMSDPVILTILSSVLTFAGTVFTGIMAYLMARMKQQQDRAAEKVEEVAVKVEEATATAQRNQTTAATVARTVAAKADAASAATSSKLDELTDIASVTHGLVNNAMAVQLELNAALARQLADAVDTPANRRVADLAEAKYREHMAKQAVVDAHAASGGSQSESR